MWVAFKRKSKSQLAEQDPIYVKNEPILEMTDEDWWEFHCLCNDLHPATEAGYIKRDQWLADRLFPYKIGDGVSKYSELEYKGVMPGAVFVTYKGTEIYDSNV